MFRKVKAKIWTSQSNSWKEVIGDFHQWGLGIEEFEQGPAVNYTIAIVELVNGKIIEAIPINIQFLTKI